MNRRDFLKRMATAGLVAVAPKIIFDLGANSYKAERSFNHEAVYAAKRFNDPFTVGDGTPLTIEMLEDFYRHVKYGPYAVKYIVNGPLR